MAAAAVLAACFGLFGGVWALRPVELAARARQYRVQFTILDFLALISYFAVPLGLMAAVGERSREEPAFALILSIGGCFVAWVIWWSGVRRASQAGVRDSRKRLLLIGVIVPLTYAVCIVGTLMVPVMIVHFLGGKPPAPVWVYAVIMAWVGYFWGVRRGVQWVLKAEAPKVEATDPWSGSGDESE